MQEEQNTMSSSNTQEESNEDQNNYLYLSKDIDGSPFLAVCEEGEWFITWGQWRVSDKLKTYEEVLEYMEKEKWNLMCAYMIALQQAARKYDKEMEVTLEEETLTKN